MKKTTLIILSIAFVIFVSGCSQQAKSTLKIISPLNGTEINGSTVAISLNITNFELVDPTSTNKSSENGKGHIHLYLDNNEQKGAKTEFVFTVVSAGKHKIRAELHKHDHSPYMPEAKEEVEITVKGGAILGQGKSANIDLSNLPKPPPLPSPTIKTSQK